MKKDRMWKLGLAVAFSLMLTMAGCGGGGGGGDVAAVNPDTDGDGIPDAVDAFPNDPTRFVSNVVVLLAGLAPAQAGFTAATAVNNTGAVVGFSEVTAAPAGIKAVRWTINPVDGSASQPATLNPIAAGGTYSAAYGVNTPGITVGESESGTTFVAAFWAPDAPGGTAATALPSSATFPNTGRSAAYAISNAAAPIIVGEATTAAGALHAAAWVGTTGAPVDLGIFPNGTFSAAYAVNENGIVVGEADTAPGVTHACAWIVNAAGAKAAGPVDLGVVTVGDVRSMAFGVDATGQVVGESENQAGEVHASLWKMDPGTLQAPQATKKDLGANGTAYAINEVGRIAGNLGTTDLGTIWDTRNLALPDKAAAPGTTFSQGLGLNSTNVLVGMSGTATGARAFVAFPK